MKNVQLSALALGAATMIFAIAPASAEVVINGTFYEESKSGVCSNGGCTVEFTAPASKVLFTKASCGFTNSPSPMAFIQLGVRDFSNASFRRVEFLSFGPPVSSTNGAFQYQTSNSVIDFLSAAGKLPTIIVSAVGSVNSNTGFTCKLTGRIQS